MMIIRPLSLLVLFAACGPHWIDVAPGTPPIQCVAARLAARGWTVDTARTDSIHVRVTRQEGKYDYVVTGEMLFPPQTSYVRVEAEWWSTEDGRRRRVGSVIDDAVEMRNAMKSCGIDAYGWRRPVQRRPGG